MRLKWSGSSPAWNCGAVWPAWDSHHVASISTGNRKIVGPAAALPRVVFIEAAARLAAACSCALNSAEGDTFDWRPRPVCLRRPVGLSLPTTRFDATFGASAYRHQPSLPLRIV